MSPTTNTAERTDGPDPGPETVLGVETSATGKRWIWRHADDRLALMMAQRLDVPEIVARVMSARGLDLETAAAFLDPKLRDALPDPAVLADMQAGAERMATAVMQGECVGLFGDYDVDGATSSALVARYLRAVGGRSVTYIPDRLTEGYGPNSEALRKLHREAGASLIVTLDCGTLAFDTLTDARRGGIDVIVVDHHSAEATLPPAYAVINPNRLDGTPALSHLAAVGVAFLFLIAVNRVLRSAGWFAQRQEPDLRQWLDLVALGTVCDVVPLTGLNRAFVTQGLKVLARRENPGLRALADVAGIDQAPSAYHLGFVLGPRINAGGRIGAADLGSSLLRTDEPAEAAALARRLDALNAERQALEADVLREAVNIVDKTDAGAPVVMAAGDGWHPGVVGIVASRLKDRFNRPACVISWQASDGDPEAVLGTGSARSVAGIDLGAAVIAARQAGHLVKGGGHKMAAGFTLERNGFDAFQAFMAERIGRQARESGAVPTTTVDGALRPDAASETLVNDVQRLAPFGAGNAEPRFVIPEARIAFADIVGEKHVRCAIERDGRGQLQAIAFRATDTKLAEVLLRRGGPPLHLLGRLRLDHWNGRTTVKFQIDDAGSA